MNSFLSLLTSPFSENRVVAPNRPPLVYKAAYKVPPATAPDPHPWSIWAASFGGETNYTGGAYAGGASVGTFGFATGFDYRVTPDTVAGFALAGGTTRFGLPNGLGGGGSDMFQAAAYSTTHLNAVYLATAVAYAWHDMTQAAVVPGNDVTAEFAANNVGGRIEGGYRFTIPGVFSPTFGVTPYAAGQAQAVRTPSYSQSAVYGPSIFALAYNASTTTVVRTELGSWFDWTMPANNDGTGLTLRARTAWAHEYWSVPDVTATFVALPRLTFTQAVEVPATDFLLASAGAEIGFGHGFSLTAWFDGEFAEHAKEYGGSAQLRYTW
jgi:outer membrane autotransporter protein